MSPQQFEGTLAVWNTLRAETLQHMVQLDLWLMLIPVLMLALIGAAHVYRFRQAIFVALMFGAFAPDLVARQDLLLHRSSIPIAHLEDQLGIEGWENHYKPRLAEANRMLVPLDIEAAVPVIVLFFYSAWVSFRRLCETGKVAIGVLVPGVSVVIFVTGVWRIYDVIQLTNQLAAQMR